MRFAAVCWRGREGKEAGAMCRAQKNRPFLLLAALCFLLGGCARQEAPETRTVSALGCEVELSAYGENAAAALAAAEQELLRIDAELSPDTGDVAALNRSGTVRSADVSYLVYRADYISEVTNGAFDITAAALSALWGFNGDEPRTPTAAELAEAVSHVGRSFVRRGDGLMVTIDLPAQVDLGGIAKGYAAMSLFELFADVGIENAQLVFGSDVCVMGTEPDGSNWRVTINGPAGSGDALGVLEASDVCVMASDEHIVDPSTGVPANSDIVSATVICRDGIWADALATAICVMGAGKAMALRETLSIDFDAIMLMDDGRVIYTCENFTPSSNNSHAYARVD